MLLLPIWKILVSNKFYVQYASSNFFSFNLSLSWLKQYFFFCKSFIYADLIIRSSSSYSSLREILKNSSLWESFYDISFGT